MKRSWHSSQHSGSSEPERYHLKDIIDGSEIFKEMEDGHQQLLAQLQAFVNKRVPWKLWTIGEVVDMWHKVINNKPIDYVVHKYAGGFKVPLVSLPQTTTLSSVMPSTSNCPYWGDFTSAGAPAAKRKRPEHNFSVQAENMHADAVVVTPAKRSSGSRQVTRTLTAVTDMDLEAESHP
ncbi:hypothetical protein EB796_016851 [Bugula neritina]|uniref:Uncharacterized protein n=1 Tax=Bugula neritina TaxID=10212 RepID=A0A7J7JEU1_BUGNE|nr:hypothetical protein EB796_016851 [Bugula neritina]